MRDDYNPLISSLKSLVPGIETLELRLCKISELSSQAFMQSLRALNLKVGVPLFDTEEH